MSNNAQFRHLVDALPVGIVVHRDRRILYANRVCLDALGLDRLDQLLGRDPIALLAGDQEVYAQRTAAVMRGETIPPIDARLTGHERNALPARKGGQVSRERQLEQEVRLRVGGRALPRRLLERWLPVREITRGCGGDLPTWLCHGTIRACT